MCFFLVRDGKMELNKSYLKSIPGILGIVAVVLNAVVFMCAVCSGSCFRGQSFFIWAELVSSIGFWISLTLLSFRLCIGTRERMIQIISPWIIIEAVIVALWGFLFFTVFLDCAINASKGWSCNLRYGFQNTRTYDGGVIGVTAFFAFAAFGVYAADLFFRFKEDGLLDRFKALTGGNRNANSSSNTKDQPQTIDETFDQLERNV